MIKSGGHRKKKKKGGERWLRARALCVTVHVGGWMGSGDENVLLQGEDGMCFLDSEEDISKPPPPNKQQYKGG